MNDHAPQPDVKTPARRKLIRGAFSVPALLAVHNGSALAASSNTLRCALNAAQNGGEAPGESSGGDKWIRVPIYKASSGSKQYVKVSDLQAVANARLLALVKPTGSSVTDLVEYKKNGTYVYAANVSVASTSKLTAVLFDNRGTGDRPIRVAGFVQKEANTDAPAGTTALSESCWTSITPAP